MPSEIRQDVTSGEYVIIASERGDRPSFLTTPSEGASPTYRKDSKVRCPFCVGNEAQTPQATYTRKTESNAWQVRVFPNKYPAVEMGSIAELSDADPLFPRQAGFGFHEVIVETPQHDQTFSQLTPEEIDLVLQAYVDREHFFRKNKGIHIVVPFRNQGPRSGATIPHAHSQILAVPFLPQRFASRLSIAQEYHAKKQRSLYDDYRTAELDQKTRVILETKHMVALSPFAPRTPFEIWILPKRHHPHFSQIDADERFDLAQVLGNLLRRLEKLLPHPDHNFVIYSAPESGHALSFSWHLKIFPRLISFAGFEIGSGTAILSRTPEEVAQMLRE